MAWTEENALYWVQQANEGGAGLYGPSLRKLGRRLPLSALQTPIMMESAMPEVPEFISSGTHEIEGRGTVYYTTCPEYVPDRSNDPWTGHTVMIDGDLFNVIAVESFALGFINKGASIGLLVEP